MRPSRNFRPDRTTYAAYAVGAYQGGNDSAGLDAVLTAAPDEGAIKRAYVESVSGVRQDYVDALKTAKAAAKDDSTRLAQAQAEAERKASEIEKARTDAAAARTQQQALNDRVQGELATLVAQEQARRQAAETAAAPAPAASQPRPEAAAPAPRSTSPVVVDTPSPPPGNGGAASIAISAALSQVGKAYVWGAAGPDAYDCSGIVLWAYAKAGVSLPHYSGAMYNMTTRISASQLQPGDLVFYGPGRLRPRRDLHGRQPARPRLQRTQRRGGDGPGGLVEAAVGLRPAEHLTTTRHQRCP